MTKDAGSTPPGVRSDDVRETAMAKRPGDLRRVTKVWSAEHRAWMDEHDCACACDKTAAKRDRQA